MRQLKVLALCLGAALVLGACGGGGGGGNQAPKINFTSLVSFGDSLSDVGTYKVGQVSTWNGGQYTVNANIGQNWTEVLSAQLGLNAPCAAQTGLDGVGVFSVTPVTHTNCRNYAQGGSRVMHPVGTGNKLLGAPYDTLGQLTVPVVTQIANHLGVVGGTFAGTELVTVLAGANDLFIQTAVLGTLGTGNFSTFAKDVGLWTQAEVDSVSAALLSGEAAALTAAAPIMASKMSDAATALANLVKTQIVANGAKYTLVINLPNISKTPFGNTLAAPVNAIVAAMTDTFNATLKTELSSTRGVKLGDAYSTNTDQINNPAQYGLTNVDAPACDLSVGVNLLQSSLICSAANLMPGDVSKYLFADMVHPTPYGHKLLAQEVAKYLLTAGWL